MPKKFIDDKFDHLESDVSKMRFKHSMYVSYSNEAAAKAIVFEIIYNGTDEFKNPNSPGNRLDIEFDERTGIIKIEDNGRGIPISKLELICTTLNSGSNIFSGNKAAMRVSTLGRNGVGTLAMTALGELTDVTTHRGGTENRFLRLVFKEGEKVHEETGKCSPEKHGMTILYKPSKVILGRRTRIIWEDIRYGLINMQFLNKDKVKVISTYIDKNGESVVEKYQTQPFEDILKYRTPKEERLSEVTKINASDDNLTEEVAGETHERFISVDISFMYTSSPTPYIDSFCNYNNTVNNGSHLDGVLEALCRYFQVTTRNSLTDREKDKLDIKWEDVKAGLALVVSMDTNMEEIFTGQTKLHVVNDDLEKIIRDRTMDSLQKHFEANPGDLKDLMGIVKLNARVRREGEKVRNAVVKDSLTNWSMHKIASYDPCINRGKQYKELFIVEGDSAKGSLNLARDPIFQALFAIRGVSANVFKLELDQILKNKEFETLITIMKCNVGIKFDLAKLDFDKIIITTDADIDALNIRSLLMAFFFKLYPEIIQDGRLYIAEPPLYRVADKKNPYVVNREDYINRYISAVTKEYRLGYPDSGSDTVFMNKSGIKEFLGDTSFYVDEVQNLSNYYKLNDKLIEIIIHHLTMIIVNSKEELTNQQILEAVDIKSLMAAITEEFNELHYDEKKRIIKGAINGRYQSFELSERFIKKTSRIVDSISRYAIPSGMSNGTGRLVLSHSKTGTTQSLTILETLKLLKRFQPEILTRFKGLGENDDEDIKFTTMDPNTRTLIKVHISDIENDMRVFQMLRGTSPADAVARKKLIRGFKLSKEDIDT